MHNSDISSLTVLFLFWGGGGVSRYWNPIVG